MKSVAGQIARRRHAEPIVVPLDTWPLSVFTPMQEAARSRDRAFALEPDKG